MSQEASEGDTRYALLRHLSEHRDETVQPTDLVTRARISHLDMRAIEAGPSSSPGAATINVVYVAGDVRDSQMQQASPEADQRFT